MSYLRSVLLILCAFTSIGVCAQTFHIQSRNPGIDNVWLNLDATTQVQYSVSASGLSGRVIPVLVPVNGAEDFVNITWTGTTATSDLSDLTFNLHLFNAPGLCNSTLEFELYFYGDQFDGPIQATASNAQLLNIDTRGSETTLTHQLSSTIGQLPWPLTSVSARNHFLEYQGLSRSILDNPSNRFYFWADYNLQGAPWGGQFVFFLYGLDNGICSMNAVTDLDFNDIVDGQVVDNTGASPTTVTQAPPGGAGSLPTQGEGINIYDVTDINLVDADCGNSVRESVNYSSGTAVLVWQYGGFMAVVRRFALYLGQPGCTVLQANFGAAPGSTFRIDDFFLSSTGEVSANLRVPSSWGSTSQLNSNMRVRYFLRRDEQLISLGSESRALNLDVLSGLTIDDPENYYLEARVRRTDSDAVVSIDNRGVHNRRYTLDGIDFEGGEVGSPDAYFDPGERMVFNWRVDEVGGASLPSLSYQSGVVYDANGNNQLDSGDDYVFVNQINEGGINLRIENPTESGSGSSRLVSVPYELLLAGSQSTMWFFVDVTGANGGVSTTYRRYFSIAQLLGGSQDLNAEDTRIAYNHDFEAGPQLNRGWSVSNASSGVGSRGWDYGEEGPWAGQGPQQAQNAADLYALNSPVWPLGRSTSLSFTHQTNFTPDASGGLLEYRVREVGEQWPAQWENLIQDQCGNCGYYDGIYPIARDSYLDGKAVWMAADGAPELLDVDIANLGFPGDAGEVQFRFVFADPSVADGNPSTTGWDVFNFAYGTNQLLADNPFGVDTSLFPLVGCEEVALSLAEWAPIDISLISFIWYEDLTDLWNENGTTPISGSLGASVPFTQTTNGLYTYYVRMSYNGMERVMAVDVNETDGISQGQAVVQILQSAAANWPGTDSVLDYTIIVNQVCPAN